jgi:RHS repeat-associated protein
MVDHLGNEISRRYFDPFGRTATASVSGSFGDLLDTNRNRRGFTDHEHLNEQKLIHMNGRVYDYNMGRFMSVDPLIQSPTSTQSINPYSYIMNNPLAGTDPTGYAAEKKEYKIKVATTGSRIKRTVTATVSGNGNCGATVTFSGANGAARSAAKNGVAGKLASAGFKVSDIGSQKAISQQSYGNDANFAKGYSSVKGDMTGILSMTGPGQAVDSIKSGIDAFEAGYEKYQETGDLTGAALVAAKAGIEAYAERKLKGAGKAFNGGAFGKLKTGNGIERHHMPADSINGI